MPTTRAARTVQRDALPTHPYGVIVEVTWLDAETATGWGAVSETPTKPERVSSVGFLLKKTSEVVVLAGDATSASDPKAVMKSEVNRTITIPIGMVRDIKRLTFT